MRSAIILVGGEAKRANGQEKYFFTYQGKTFIERQVDTLRGVVDEIVLVARDPEQCRRFASIEDIRCITDIRRGIGPIGGLHAGTLAAKGDVLFVSACDMPCIRSDVVEYLFATITGYDAAIPCWNSEMLEPLHAVYRRDVLLDYLKSHESFSLRPMIRSINTRYVPVEEIRKYDPDLGTFTNINRLEELKQFNSRTDEKNQPDCLR
ncbi:MAG: molybdopterin-guanine dinucleotide biosynthesis protein MobA [Methanoregula sp. PtaU1.Bin051]|nr:MAG: molybdopterin-guanine dinucleotide biosynthesis protein MobA [Methanoregula sp. PtaU1.Bin051]